MNRKLSIDGFNQAVQVGDSVVYANDFGERIKTRTRSQAQMLSGHTPVVWLECKTGCVALDRVSPT